MDKVYVNLGLSVISLIAIPETLLGEVEGHVFFLDYWRATTRSGGICRINWWRPPCQFMVSIFSSFLSVAAGGVFCQVFDSLLLVPQEPCERRLLVDRVVFPTDPPPVVQGGAGISETRCVSVQKQDFHAVRMPRSCGEIILCA